MAGLAVALVGTTVKAPARAAAVDGVTWTPGDVTWEILKDGRCLTSQSVNVNTKSHDAAVSLSNALQTMPRKTDYPPETGIQDIHANVGSTVNTTHFPVVLHAYLPGGHCKQANAAQQTLSQAAGGGTLDTIELAAAPAWMKGALSAVVGASVFAAVTIMVTAGITATGVLVGASATTVAAVTALSACIGGASSTAASLMVVGSGESWQQNLANAVTGCITGMIFVTLPIKTAGQAAGNAIRAALGSAPAETVGEAGVAAAASAGVALLGITGVTNAAADAAVKVE